MDNNIHHPSVVADVVVFGFDGVGLNILLMQRNQEPFQGSWGLPDGYLNGNETIEQCGERVLRAATGICDAYMEQFCVFSDPGRDSRERTLAVGLMALVPKANTKIENVDRNAAMRLAWFPIEELPQDIAFDHLAIIDAAYVALRNRSRVAPVVFNLLSFKFSVSELQRVLEVINSVEYDRRNFYRKAIATNLLNPEGLAHMRAAHRPPQLFSFRKDAYDEMMSANPAAEYPFAF